MPDTPENLINRQGVALGLPKTPIVPNPNLGVPGNQNTDLSVNDYFLNKIPTAKPTGAADIPMSSVYTGRRYDETRPGTDLEEMAGQQQSAWDKLGNGLVKLAGSATTSLASGTVGLVYGALSAVFQQRLASLIDNDVTRKMDQLSSTLEDTNPNYYTKAETNAEWYSPSNILTANFWTDKIIKNLGFSIGALGGGVAWSSLFKSIGLTNALVRSGAGLEAATAIEETMATAPNLQKHAAFENALNSLSQKYIKSPIGAVLKDSDRILTSTMGTFGEASIEGLQNMNEFRNKAIEEYTTKFGAPPKGKELDDINKYADKIGMYTWGFNSLLLTGTNYIQLPKILSSSRKADKALINEIGQEGIGGEFTKTVAKTRFGKLVDGVRGVSNVLFAPSEAFEEGAQYAIQTGVNDYFKRGYKNKADVSSFLTNMNETAGNVFGEGIDRTLNSKEGLESILIGGLSGGIQQGGFVGTYKNEEGKTRLGFGKSGVLAEQGLFGLGGERGENTDIAIAALNKTRIAKVLQDGANFMGIAIGSQKLRQEAIASNDKLSEKDYEADYALSYIMPRVKYGKVDSINNELSYYESQAMDTDGFRELRTNGIVNQNETREQFLQRINTIRESANSIDQLYSVINDKYNDKTDKEGNKMYSDEVIDKLVYASSKIRDYDNRIPGVNELLVGKGIDTQAIIDSVVKTGNLDVDAVTKASEQIREAGGTNDDIEDGIANLRDLSELALRRKQFIDEYNDIKDSPEKYITPEETDKELTTEDDGTPKQIIKVKSKDGDEDLEVGTEYFLGRVTRKDEKGNPVYGFPRLTVLGENEDGTIKIKDSEGQIHDLPKAELLKFKLGKVSDTLNNYKAKWFMENVNSMFEMKRKGGKKPIPGRLEYNHKNGVLDFVYTDFKGEEQRMEVTYDQFEAQDGFAKPLIEKVGEYTAVQKQALKEFKKQEDPRKVDKVANRLAILNNLYEKSKARLDEVRKQLDKNKKKLSDAEEALDNLSKTAKGLPRKNFTKAIRATIDSLSSTKSFLEKENDQLEIEQDELETNLAYFSDFISNIEELPDNKGIIDELKDDVNTLEELIDHTADAIKNGKSLLESVDAALEQALSLFNDFVKRLKEENPDTPLFLEQFQEKLEKYLGEEGAKLFIQDKLGYTEAVMDLEDQMDTFKAELKIPELTKKAEKLREQLKELSSGVDDLIKEQIAKSTILQAFEDAAERYREQKAEEDRIKNNQALMGELMGSADPGLQTRAYDKAHETVSKKSDMSVVLSTTTPSKSDQPHVKRANLFGINFGKFTQAKKDKTKGVIITSKNEADFGLAGLMQHLKDISDATPEEKAAIKPEQTVVLLVVGETRSGSFRPVNANGDVIEDSDETVSFDNTIYQTFPDPKLQWSAQYDNASMFRKGETPEATIEYYKKEYGEWHQETLDNPTNDPHSFEASFGIPDNVMTKDDKGDDVRDYDAATSVEDAGLVTAADLRTKPVIYVPTTNKTVSKGSTFFDSPLGRPFLALRNAYVKLQNRKLTKNEAATIYEAIHQLAIDVFKNGNAKSEESRRLFNWLKSIVYWGTPRNAAGYNSIFFEKTDQGLMLFISGKGKSFPFTFTKLEENKTEILAGIESMYNNINYTMVSSDSATQAWKDAYEEIVSISPDGKIETRQWQNYQTYLLSREGRDASEPLPLSTQMVPYKEDTPNRDGIYFTLTDTADTERYSKPPKPVTAVAATPATLAPVAPGAPLPAAAAPVAQPAPVVRVAGEFDIEGGENTIAIGANGTATFTIDAKKYIDTDGAEGFNVDIKGETIQNLMTNRGYTQDQAKEAAYTFIISKAQPQIDAYKQQLAKEQAGEVAAAQEAPVVSDTKPKTISGPIEDSGSRVRYTGPKDEELLPGAIGVTVRSLADGFIVVKFEGGFQLEVPKNELELIEPVQKSSTTVSVKQVKDATTTQRIEYLKDRIAIIEKRIDAGVSEPVDIKEIEDVRKELAALEGAKPSNIDQEIQDVLNAKNKEELIKTSEKLVGINPYDGAVSMGTRAALMTPGSFEKGKSLFLDEVKGAIEQKRKIEGAKPVAAAPVEPARIIAPNAADMALIREQMNNMRSRTPLRKIIEKQIKKFKPENWKQVEAFLKIALPTIPVYRVKNVIQSTNGAQAWGMFKDGAIYINENAEVGTVYHEVFHAVWRMFSDPVEQALVMNEFKKRSGSFTDRPTGQTIKYSEATDNQIEEQLAEEYRDYVQYGKIPAKPASGRPYIIKLFSDLANFIKELFTGKKATTNTEKLFKKIGTGYYNQFNQNQSSLAFAKKGIIDIEEAYASSDSAFRIKNIPADQVHDIMQEMTYTILTDLTSNNKSLFSIPKLNKEEEYAKLLDSIQKTALSSAKATQELIDNGRITPEQGQPIIENSFALWKKITDEWDEIRKKHEEYLKTYSIEFDESNNSVLNDENNSGRGDYQDARKIDLFKSANSAIKLLLSTIPIVDEKGDFIYSSINGAKLLPTSQVFMSLMNNLHTSRNIDEMMERLRQMAKNDPNYRTLYSRLTNTSYTTNTLDLADIDEVHDGQLLSAFWRTFKKQNPDVKNVYIFENGDIEIGDSNLSSAARQVSSEYVEAFKKVLTGKNPYFEYATTKKAYVGKPDGVKDVRKAFNKAKTDSESLDIMISFLKSIGIEFKKEEIVKLPGDKQDTFKAAVNGILSSIEKAKSVATVTGKVLDLEGRFMGLATIRAAINNPEFDSTFFNVQGERMQSFIGTNAASDLFDALSQLSNKRELAGTPYAYLLTDEFSQFSVIIDKMFDSETGDRIAGSEQLMKTGYVDGTINQENGKKKESSKLTYKERLIQEINLNLKGWYYSLVPGDASIEWMTKMGNHISADRLLSGFGDVHKIFKGYFLSELELSRADRPIVSLNKRSDRDLRFLKPILENYEEGLHDKILKETKSPEEVYKKYESKIKKAVEAFINKEASSLRATLNEYGILTTTETGYKIENIAFSEAESMSEAVLNRQLTAVSINYMINNIEFHKILYSDPYQYSDELKRIKNFNSPRQAIVNGSAAMNAAYQKIWNKNYKPGDLGYTNFTDDFFRSITHEDVIGKSDLKDYGTFEETDGGGIISIKALRQFKIRAGDWNDDNELQYEYDIAYEKVVKGKGLTEEEKEEKKLTLSAKEKAFNIQEFTNKDGSISYIGKNPDVKSTYTPIKPIVAGNKGNGRLYNDVLLDKFALYPLSFRIMHMINPESNAIRQYEKMKSENIDYVVFASGRKVGAEKLNPIYNPVDGSFNTDDYEGIVNVPFGIMSIQSEVPSKDTTDVSRGSQVTKLVTMDYMQAGVPVDFEIEGKPNAKFTEKYKAWFDLKTEEAKEKASPIYKEIKNNQVLLEEIMDEGYKQLLKKLGIEETILDGKRKEFKIVDFSKAAETLRDEILKREVNDNISDALAGFLAGEAVLEATPAYQQVRNILYSIADKNVISPKMNGGLKVQIPATFLESVKAVGKPFVNKKGETKYSYESNTLDFYVDEDGKRVCEIIVGRWFKSDMTDADLLKYLNDTKEGQKILEGVAFRIPTQKQNSIDAFRIKQFMPREFGDSVIVPSALVKKVGSDFDIDKLSLYFKNVLVNAKGVPVMVPFYGYGEQAKEKIGKWLVDNELSSLKAREDADAIDKLSEEDEDKDISEIDKYYKKSLQNAYIQSMQNLITHPKNFKRLTTPNSADQLKDLASKITKQLGFEEFDYSSTGNMLSRRFMSRLRHAFVTGKYAIGIAAVNQTNHSLNQRQPIYVDFDRFDNVSNTDKKWLTGGTGKQEDLRVKFKNFNKLNVNGKMVATLSMIENADGQDISDIIGQFIDGYVDISKGPWIMELGATPNVASTFLFLAKIGVPIDQVAYFMNQPIIRDYLRSIESAGYSYLFMDKFVKDIKGSDKYKTTSTAKFDEIPSKTKLFETIGAKELTPEQRAEQQFILDEFLKYAKMAEHMYYVTQGSNFDTATFNDPYLVFKKQMQLIKAQNSIISSVDKLLENSFVGKIKSLIYDIRDSFAQVLKSDNPTVRNIVQDVLMDYVDLPDGEFIKVAQKTVNDLFDWAVQVDIKLNAHVKSILLGTETNNSAARQIYDVIKPIQDDPSHSLHNNLVVKSLVPRFAEKTGQVNNLKIKNKDNKVYDQNQMIYAFQELKNHLDLVDNTLYKKLIALSILQSGLSNSPISFTSLIPYEDFKNIYNKTLATLETFPNLANFADINVFQRNNWNNYDLVPYKRGKLIATLTGRYFYPELAFYDKEELKKDMQSGKIPQVIKLSARSREANNDIITYSWEENPDVTDEDRKNGIKNAKQKKLEMRKQGDFSFIKKGLFKKVMVGDEALVHPDRKGNPQYIYKMINAWGDSFRANEFYDSARKSVIENGYIKVDKEVADSTIAAYFETSNNSITLKDGVTYNTDAVNSDMLEAMGYTPEEIGEILKSIC